MKKRLLIFLLVLSLLPMKVFAKSMIDDYNTKNFVETLEAEDMKIENKDYKETDDQAIIYLFRGDGCGYCRAFLTFLNSISKEYGKYFKVISFEVWGDSNNSALLEKVPLVTNQAAGGVPYIIIGEKCLLVMLLMVVWMMILKKLLWPNRMIQAMTYLKN